MRAGMIRRMRYGLASIVAAQALKCLGGVGTAQQVCDVLRDLGWAYRPSHVRDMLDRAIKRGHVVRDSETAYRLVGSRKIRA